MVGLLCTVCRGADTGSDVGYDLRVTLHGHTVHIEHLLINRSGRSICFYPENIDVAFARFFSKSGAEMANVSNSGFVTSPQTIYIVYADSKPHSFESSHTVEDIFKSTADAEQAATAIFELNAYDCRALISTGHSQAPAVVHHKITASVMHEYRPAHEQ